MEKYASAALGTAAWMIGSLLAAAPASATAPVGVTVYAEEWTPSKINSESLRVLENNPTLLSDTLNSAWTAFRQWYLGTIPQILQRQNYLHSVDASIPTGISLYDIKGNTHLPPEMTLPAKPEFTIKSDGPNTLRVNFTVPGASISLCSTTPTPVGRYGDPCATLSVDVSLGMGIQISDTPGHLLTVTTANVTTSNFKAQDPNLPLEIVQGLAAVYAYLGGPDYQATLVHTIDTNKINVTSQLQAPVDQMDKLIGGYEQSALTAINQLLQPAASVDRLLHVALVVQPANGGSTLAVLLAPPTTGVNFTASGMTGQFKGTLTFDSSVKTLPASCSDLDRSTQFTGQVQSGPRQVVAFNGATPVYGNAPTQPLNLVFDGDHNPLSASRSCPYNLEHLVVGFPNYLNFSSFTYKATGQAQISTHLEIQPSHWSNPVIVGANGIVISTGTASASTGLSASRQVQNGSFARSAMPVPAGGAPNQSQTWTTTNPLAMQTSAQMDLVASLGVSYQPGVGALPQQAHIGAVSPGDPASQLTNQTKAPVWGAAPATTAAPSWAPAARSTSAAITTGVQSTFRATTMQQVAQPLQQQVQQPAVQAAPSSLSR